MHFAIVLACSSVAVPGTFLVVALSSFLYMLGLFVSLLCSLIETAHVMLYVHSCAYIHVYMMAQYKLGTLCKTSVHIGILKYAAPYCMTSCYMYSYLFQFDVVCSILCILKFSHLTYPLYRLFLHRGGKWNLITLKKKFKGALSPIGRMLLDKNMSEQEKLHQIVIWIKIFYVFDSF